MEKGRMATIFGLRFKSGARSLSCNQDCGLCVRHPPQSASIGQSRRSVLDAFNSKMNPQLFRASLITAAIAVALSGSANGQDVRQNQPSTPTPTGAKPNILFIMADDHAWQAVSSAYGEA